MFFVNLSVTDIHLEQKEQKPFCSLQPPLVFDRRVTQCKKPDVFVSPILIRIDMQKTGNDTDVFTCRWV